MVAKKSKTSKASKSTALVVRARDTEMIEVVDEGEALVPRSNLSVYSDHPTLDGSDLFIPKLRLAQGLTAEVQSGEAKPGQWLLLGMVPVENVTVVPIGMAKRRELREVGSRTVLCRSADAVNGNGEPGGACDTCEFSHWLPAPVKKGQPAGTNMAPKCTFIYSYMVFVVESKKMAILELSRTGELAGRMLNTMIVQSGFGNFAVKLGSTSKKGPQGLYYAPSISATSAKAEDLKRAVAEAKSVK
jgi:hypothetical protein